MDTTVYKLVEATFFTTGVVVWVAFVIFVVYYFIYLNIVSIWN